MGRKTLIPMANQTDLSASDDADTTDTLPPAPGKPPGMTADQFFEQVRAVVTIRECLDALRCVAAHRTLLDEDATLRATVKLAVDAEYDALNELVSDHDLEIVAIAAPQNYSQHAERLVSAQLSG